MLRVRADYNSLPREEGSGNERLRLLQRRIRAEASNSSSSERRALGELRVVTYNVLAEPFATSEHAMTRLFGYCDPTYLQSEYRSQVARTTLPPPPSHPPTNPNPTLHAAF